MEKPVAIPGRLPQGPGVYVITNKRDSVFYIGSSTNVYRRKFGHLSDLKLNRHCNARMQRVWRKYGNVFEFGLLEECDLENLHATEQKWLDKYKVASRRDCYNVLPDAYSAIGHVVTAATRAKISKGLTGKKLSAEHREKLRQAKLGHKQTPEQIAKRVAKMRGRKQNRPSGYAIPCIRRFTSDEIVAMRQMKADGKSYSAIMKLTGVSLGGLFKIVKRQTYRDV